MSTSPASLRTLPSLRLAHPSRSAALPAPLTPLLGREREVALAVALLRRADVRLLTITGPGGIGKTRLAIELGRSEASAYPDGVVFVPLAVVSDPNQVAEAIARALGVQESIEAAGREGLVGALRDAVALLILDNFEHILEAAPLLTELLAVSPGLKVVVTSRSLLRLAGEFALPVPPLVLPDADEDQPLVEVRQTPAVQLFVDRIQAVSPGFALTDETAVVVGRICRHLDGLPLAIELAAAQAAVLPPVALFARIQAQLPLPVSGPRDAPARLRTITDAVAWSYDLLTSDEQRFFRRMSVFVGGFGLDAAEAVGGLLEGQSYRFEGDSPGGLRGSALRAEGERGRDGDGKTGRRKGGKEQTTFSPSPPHGDSRVPLKASALSPSFVDSAMALEVLASLVDKSLVQQQSWEGEARFVMLETIRVFAWNQLVASGEAEAVRAVHASWVLFLAEPAEMAVAVPGQERRLRRLEIDQPNLIAALTWLDRQGNTEGLLRLAAAYGGIALANGRFREGRDWLERVLARAPAGPSPVRGRALISLGRLVSLFDEVDRADALLTEGIAAMDPKLDALVVAFGLIRQGAVANQLGKHDRAEHLLNQALVLVDDIYDPVTANIVAGTVLGNLGVAAQCLGDLDLARTRYEQALVISRENNHSFGIVRYLRDLGDVDRDRGDYVAALASYKQCLDVLNWQVEPRVLVDVLEGAALAAAAWQEPVKAARLLGAAEVLRDGYGGAFMVPTDVVAHQRTLAVVRSALNEAAIQVAWEAGRAFSVSDAIAEVQALSPPEEVATFANTVGRDIKLSARELDVLRLLVAGHSDREIAEALYLSVRTIEAHVARILGKLGVRTRTAAVGAALTAGVIEPDSQTPD